MEPICSFSELAKSCCGEFRKSPKIVRKLLEYKHDIPGHSQKFEENQGWIELEDQEKDKMTAACLNDQSRLAKKDAEMTTSNVKHWEGTPVAAKTMYVSADWTLGQWTGEDSGDSEEVAAQKFKNTIFESLCSPVFRAKLKKLHEPYERITDWQIKRARAHARECGPGFAVEKSTSHRVRLNKVQVDHFIDFINKPFFYQDVAYGTRTFQMDSGATLKMPNVIRTVTRSTMIDQYLMFCKEENVEPLGRTTLFRILQVREAFKQKSLCGVDNTAADGSAGFEKLCKIVDDLQELRQDDNWSKAIKKSLLDGKRYLKTQYRNHCRESESPCPDHCLKFGLSDPKNADLNETCAHEHTTRCNQCDNISTCMNNI
ncbi:Hypothetical predicted protein [Paramuricea clavata]|uniref:Uncharacterized protein n=1 Tax=Paramuricea clavata TaxID=317549 RepID=A0A6S7HJF9_PARCT|nr:Hypothetical predicted protein [Paramuricea clavata]